MAFFNYSTMQMTAKIVYYGPGLCGKTTNLQYIYGHTTQDSRGEMVSLETQTDRTLFFDLLPMEVGTVAGFRTKIQLYTVPGQVFYNTTRKLVLKGVDGVVFVADSQRPMLRANLDSLRNLEENLASLGISLDSIPLVLQFNKRDLMDISPVDELNRTLNRNGWLAFEASALTGAGVFETLRGISRLTLLSLRKQLETSPERAASARERARRPKPPSVEPAPTPPGAAPAGVPAAAPAAAASGAPTATSILPDNGRASLSRNLLLNLNRNEFRRARRVLVSLQVQDDRREVVRAVENLQWELTHSPSLKEFLLRLNIALNAED